MPKRASPIAFAVQGATLRGGDRVLFQDLHLSLRAGVVTAVLGPSGTGKSALLRALGARQHSPDLKLEGGYWFDGTELSTKGDPDEIVWTPQRLAHRHSTNESFADAPSLDEVLNRVGSTLLLDEPTRGMAEAQKAALAKRLRAFVALRGTVVVVTHDLTFAKAVADEICMLVAGACVYCGGATRFFERPSSPLIARFLRLGNCWPADGEALPGLPSHFRWLLAPRVAGMGRPGLSGDPEHDLRVIRAYGVRRLVSLTEEPYPQAGLVLHGIELRHFPIPDMGVPSSHGMARLCADLERGIADGEVTVIHCHAGLGRTGLALAALLIWMRWAPAQAIAYVRRLRRGYIQSSAQLTFLRCFADQV